MHGTLIAHGPADWQVLQHRDGFAAIALDGTWTLPQAAIDVGVATTRPVFRLVNEADGFPVLPWEPAEFTRDADGHGGTWRARLLAPAGGPYRIETGLDTVSTTPGLAWMFRGDLRLHVCVGDVFVIAGQSNAAGYARDSAYDPPDLMVHHFRNNGAWDLACHPLNESTGAGDDTCIEMGNPGSSPYLSFARQFSALSRRPVGLVSTALGGQPIARWDDRESGDLEGGADLENRAPQGDFARNPSLLARLIARVRASGSDPAGVLWYQGCSDAKPDTCADYGERFAHVVESLRRALGYDIPVFTFQLNRALMPASDEGWGLVREAQRMAARSIPGVYALPTLDAGLSDGIHNGAHANAMLGERLARQCGHALYGTAPLAAPDIARTVCAGRALCLRFDHAAALTLPDADPAHAGFTVRDAAGEIAVESLMVDRNRPGELLLTLARAPERDAAVSFAWQANPTRTPPLDSVTYLPPLAFYQVPVTFEKR